VRVCRFRAAPAEALEEAVLNIVAGGALPEGVVATARAELRRRLETPDVANVGRQRARLRPGEAVYDPFVGSGTCLVAAETLGRRCYGMEIEPRYVQLTIERWQALTGAFAARIEQ
jgi:hypothetical protein